MVKVLFVCTGNICRSPTAEGVMRHLIAQAGLASRLTVDSAGTTGFHVGDPPDRRSAAAARRRGYDLSAQRARQVELGDFAAFDMVVAMGRDHLTHLLGLCPPPLRPRVRLMRSFTDGPQAADVPDPYYGGERGFEDVLDMLEASCAALLAELRRSLPEEEE